MLNCLGVMFVLLVIVGLLVVAWPLAVAILVLLAVIAIVKGALR